MNFLEICKLVRQECGIQGDSLPTAVTSQRGMLLRVVNWVQAADNIIQTKHADWDFLWEEFNRDTILNSDIVLKPDDFGMWDTTSFAVNQGLASGRPLTFTDYKDWRVNKGLKTVGSPSSVTVLPNGNLTLNAPADKVYAINGVYWRTPTPLAENDDIPAYPDRFHRALVARAKMFFFEDQEAWDNYKLAQAEFDLKMNELEGYALPGQQFRSQAQPSLMAARPI